VKDINEIKNHPWFSDVNWELLAEKKIIPPFKPQIAHEHDVANFDSQFTKEGTNKL